MLVHNSLFMKFGFPVVAPTLDKEVEDSIQGLWADIERLVAYHREKTAT